MAELPGMRLEAEVVVTGLRVGDLLVPITDAGVVALARPLCPLESCVLDPGHRLAHRDGNGTVLRDEGDAGAESAPVSDF